MARGLGRLPWLLAAVLLAVAVGTSDFGTRASGPDLPYRALVPEVASDSAASPNAPSDISPAELARRLVQAPDLVSAVIATQEALARGGVATIGHDERPYMSAVAPAATMTLMVPETARLAIEARNRADQGMLNAAEFGQMLEDFGWQFPAGSDPGQKITALFQTWVNEAQKAPSDPLSFTPLFLQAMAKYQDPPIDLGAEPAAPHVLWLTALEIELFGAAFDRGLPRLPLSESRLGRAAASAPAPCSFIKDSTGQIGMVKLPGQVTDVLAGELFGDALKAGLQRAGLSAGEAGELSDALGAVGTVMRLLKLIELYRSGNVQVRAIDHKLHKPVEQDDIDIAFEAVAGVSDADWEAYRKKWGGEYGMKFNSVARDCLNAAGLPAVPDLSDLAADVENWRVEWSIVEGWPAHAQVSTRNKWNDEDGRPLPGLGRLEKPLGRSGDYSATADFLVNILPETKADHESGSSLTVSPVTVKASLKTSGMPSLSTFVNGAKGGLGLVDAIVELAAGWFQAMVTPKSYATVEVEYEAEFEVDFVSRVHAELDGWVLDGRVEARGVRTGTVGITSTTASEIFPGCSAAFDTRAGTFAVLAVEPVLAPDGSVKDFEVLVRPSGAGWTTTLSCPFVGTVVLPVREHDDFYRDANAGRSIGAGYRLTGWTVTDGGAKATVQYTGKAGPATEVDTYTIRRISP